MAGVGHPLFSVNHSDYHRIPQSNIDLFVSFLASLEWDPLFLYSTLRPGSRVIYTIGYIHLPDAGWSLPSSVAMYGLRSIRLIDQERKQ